MELNDNQEKILKAYAEKCEPVGIAKTEDFYLLCNNLYIHKGQNHITDKGLAYVVGYMDYPFVKFLRAHKWERRLKIFLDFAQREFKTDTELNLYFKEKYKMNLKYETWGPDGQEQQLQNKELKSFAAEMFANLLQYEEIDYMKVYRLFNFAADQLGFELPDITKEEFTSQINRYILPK